MSDEERAWREAITEQVRRNCTLPSEFASPDSDKVVAAVCDWIENPPPWSDFHGPVFDNEWD